jgi:RNA polymerase sigma factor (sigma-70 family)
MPAAIRKYDLDLSKIGDEELVLMAQECGFRPAANELVLRYHQLMTRLIACKARQTNLTENDVEDAKQNAVFALFEAIARYNTLEMVRPGGCRFRSYGRLVTMRRFWDFVKQIRRLQKRYHCAARADGNAAAEPIEAGRGKYASNLLHQRINDDPGDAAARQELLGKLSQVLERLEEQERALWQELLAGKKLRQIACELGIGYDAVRRQRRKLLAHLSTAVRELA